MVDAHLGAIGVWLAFVASIVGAVVMAVGLARSRRDAPASAGGTGAVRAGAGDGRLLAPVMLVGALLAVGAMEHALLTHDFSLVFVAENNSTVTPLLYSITGLWSALAGSILLWGFVLCVVTSIFVWRYRRQAVDPVIRWATLVLYVVSAFFFGLMVGPANPFTTASGVTQGLGPNSLLQDNPLVAIHPPLLYIGFVLFTVPFAFAIGMLATGRRRRPLADRVPALDTGRVHVPLGRHRARRLVVLPGARAGVASGAGTRSRTPPFCRGCAGPRTSIRSSSRSGEVSCGCGTFRCRSPPSPSPSLGPSSRDPASSRQYMPSPSRRSARSSSGSSSPWSSSVSASSRGAATACAHRGGSTRPSDARVRSCSTTCCSSVSRSWCCSAPCIRFCTRRSRSSRSPSARPSSTRSLFRPA